MAVLHKDDLNILKILCSEGDKRNSTEIYLPYLDRRLEINDLLDTIDNLKKQVDETI